MSEDSLPWIEKYRPKILSDLSLDDTIYSQLERIIKSKLMKNLIITGLPGIGKTSTIYCLANHLLGKNCSECVLELNASDDRGIKAVQESITQFCKKKINKDTQPFKIILLDEADNLTSKAQLHISSLMEEYGDTTRFAFTCNSSTQIIEAIQSRCDVLRYPKISDEKMRKKIREICKKEKVPLHKSGENIIVLISQGDLRTAVNNIQLTFNGYGKINECTVYSVCDKPHHMLLKDILIDCKNGDFKGALTKLDKINYQGYSGSDIVLSMLSVLKSKYLPEIDEDLKIQFIRKISDTSIIISKGVDTALQLTGCIASMVKVSKNQ